MSGKAYEKLRRKIEEKNNIIAEIQTELKQKCTLHNAKKKV